MSPGADLLEVVHGRHNEMIDPSLHVWGWEIPVYLFLGGLAAGLLVLSAALARGRDPGTLPAGVRRAPFLALALLTAGMGALFLDLELPRHVYRFYLALEPASPMSWGSWILILVYPAGLALGLELLDGFERRRLAELLPAPLRGLVPADGAAPRRGVLAAAVVAGVALGTYTGLLLGTLAARPAWNSTLLGPLFLVSGVSTAAATLALLRPGESVRGTLGRWELGLLPLEGGLIALLLLDLATGSRVSQAAAAQFLGGPYTGPFFALVVGAGLAVPFALELAERRRHLPPTAAAAVLVLAGGLSLRWILLAAGQSTSFAALG